MIWKLPILKIHKDVLIQEYPTQPENNNNLSIKNDNENK